MAVFFLADECQRMHSWRVYISRFVGITGDFMTALVTAAACQRYTPSHRQQDTARLDDHGQALERFLAEVEKPAYRMAQIGTRNPDDALDIVQDAMIRLVERYSNRPRDEWRPLFYTILNSRLMDYHRRNSRTRRIFSWFSGEEDDDPLQTADDSGPLNTLVGEVTLESLLSALEALPLRQQQVFMMRVWQGFSVRETARVLKCSEGSVKTHLSRATETLMRAVDEDTDHG